MKKYINEKFPHFRRYICNRILQQQVKSAAYVAFRNIFAAVAIYIFCTNLYNK